MGCNLSLCVCESRRHTIQKWKKKRRIERKERRRGGAAKKARDSIERLPLCMHAANTCACLLVHIHIAQTSVISHAHTDTDILSSCEVGEKRKAGERKNKAERHRLANSFTRSPLHLSRM